MTSLIYYDSSMLMTWVYYVYLDRENTLHMLKQQKAVGARTTTARTIVDRLVCNVSHVMHWMLLTIYYLLCVMCLGMALSLLWNLELNAVWLSSACKKYWWEIGSANFQLKFALPIATKPVQTKESLLRQTAWEVTSGLLFNSALPFPQNSVFELMFSAKGFIQQWFWWLGVCGL